MPFQLDPKLTATVLTAALTRLAVEVLGVAEPDPLLQGGIALAVAAVAGYLTANEGTILRTEHADGNAYKPEVS
jgi:hypothetical protein